MNKRDALGVAGGLRVPVVPSDPTVKILETIQDAVNDASVELAAESRDEGADPHHIEALERFLTVAAERGFHPVEEVEGEVVEEGETQAPQVDREQGPDTADVPVDVADEVETALALREQAVDPTIALPTPSEFNAAQAIARQIASTTFVPVSYRGRPDDVLAAILFGREIGLGPMTAMRDVHMIDGRPALAAHRQLALLRKGGVVILESESTGERAWIRARRSDTGEVMSVEFTMEEASKVVQKGKHLVDKDNWKSYPADMLWARCVGRLTRRLGPDLLGGLPPYVAEEVADFSGWGVEYGEDGGIALRQEQQAPPVPEYRREYPDYNWPQSLSEILDRLSLVLADRDAAIEWIRQATEHLFPGKTTRDMDQGDRTRLGQALASVLADLDTNWGGDAYILATDRREIVQRAFAKRLDGTALDGPEWRIGPLETDRLTRDEWLVDGADGADADQDAADAADEPQGAQAGFYDHVEDDEIVFGDPNPTDEGDRE